MSEGEEEPGAKSGLIAIPRGKVLIPVSTDEPGTYVTRKDLERLRRAIRKCRTSTYWHLAGFTLVGAGLTSLTSAYLQPGSTPVSTTDGWWAAALVLLLVGAALIALGFVRGRDVGDAVADAIREVDEIEKSGVE